MHQSIIKLAIVDDHELIRTSIVSLLEMNRDFKVVMQAANGKDFLNQLTQTEEFPDIVLLDINMPEINGYETTLILRKEYPALKCIALSFYNEEYNIVRMLKSGACACLPKSVRAEYLFEAIVNVHLHGFHHLNLGGGDFFTTALTKEIPDINEKELLFLQLCCEGLTNHQIGDRMAISTRSVEYYLTTLGNKFGIKNRTALMIYAIKIGLVSI